MNKTKATKKALLMSMLSMLICVAMLIGSTFAWFTDSVTSGRNTITAGNLDIELEYAKAAPASDGTMKLGEWKKVTTETTDMFQPVGGSTLWEPGHTEVVYLRVSNLGSLALKYKLAVSFTEQSSHKYPKSIKLSEYLVFGQAISAEEPTPYTDRKAAQEAAAGTLLPSDQEYVTLVVYMPEDVGNEANYTTGQTAPSIDFVINLIATQTPHEPDSFDENYDKNAQPEGDEISAGDLSEPVPAEGEVNFDFGDGAVQVAVPVEDVEGGAEKITLSVKETTLPSGIACDEDNGDGSKSYTISVTPLMSELPYPINVKIYLGDWYQTADAYINREEVGDHLAQEHDVAGYGIMTASAENVTFEDGYVSFSTKEVGTFSIVGHGFKYNESRVKPGNVVISGLGNIEIAEDGVLTLPDTIAGKPVIRIEQMAFYDQEIESETVKLGKIKEVHIGKYVEEIGNSAFRSLRGMEKINIPASVNHIAEYVFADCVNLQFAYFDAPDNWWRTGTVAQGGRPTGGTRVDSEMLADPEQAGPYLYKTNTPPMYRITD